MKRTSVNIKDIMKHPTQRMDAKYWVRINNMVDSWNENGYATSHLDNDDSAFFEKIGIPMSEVGTTSQTGSDVVYFDTTRQSIFNRDKFYDNYARGGEITSYGLSFSKVDYDVNVNPSNLEVDVNIKESDSVDQYGLNDTDAEWSQHSWGYMVYPKSVDQLYDVLKALKCRVSKKRLEEWYKKGGSTYEKGGMIDYVVVNQSLFNENVKDLFLGGLRSNRGKNNEFIGDIEIELTDGNGWATHSGEFGENDYVDDYGFKIINKSYFDKGGYTYAKGGGVRKYGIYNEEKEMMRIPIKHPFENISNESALPSLIDFMNRYKIKWTLNRYDNGNEYIVLDYTTIPKGKEFFMGFLEDIGISKYDYSHVYAEGGGVTEFERKTYAKSSLNPPYLDALRNQRREIIVKDRPIHVTLCGNYGTEDGKRIVKEYILRNNLHNNITKTYSDSKGRSVVVIDNYPYDMRTSFKDDNYAVSMFYDDSSYAEGGDIPKGYHKMPDGTIMADSGHYAKGGEIKLGEFMKSGNFDVTLPNGKIYEIEVSTIDGSPKYAIERGDTHRRDIKRSVLKPYYNQIYDYAISRPTEDWMQSMKHRMKYAKGGSIKKKTKKKVSVGKYIR